MKLFNKETNIPPLEAECAGRLMDTVPLLMRVLRREVRSRRPEGLSVPQFRVLIFLGRRPGATLSEVTNHIGLTRPTLSKMVDGLVRRGWVARETADTDRRFLRLSLTGRGLTVVEDVRELTRRRLDERLQTLSGEDRAVIVRALTLLRTVFSPEDKLDEEVLHQR
jgi:DNA-binding MarR family transcriptional regulator